jgi:cyclohexa-1,5-dienecarbonyl-CoA hydratase
MADNTSEAMAETGGHGAMRVHTKIEGGVATLTLDHPPVNVITQALARELREAIRALAEHADLRVLVIAATGKHFSAGADVAEHLPPTFRDLIPEFVETVEAVAEFPQPVIAAVRGRCLGGGFELAQAADLVIAEEGASFGQPEILLGVIAPVACVTLPRLAGPGAAAELLFTGDAIGAPRAAAMGLVQRVVPDGRVDEEAAGLAARLARLSAPALRLTKHALRGAAVRTRSDALRLAERIYVDELMATEDAVEGLQAFLEKRPPVWRHR